MPRKPTLIARRAKEELLQLVSKLPSGAAIPTVRELGGAFDLHPSTMFRMLRDLAAEGVVWQSPGGRFFPATSRRRNLKGAPLCFIGREMCQWFRLYQEILGGISEVCSANGSPLILLSAPSLVRQSGPTEPPCFAPLEVQKKELASLLARVPRGCGGYILDHLWNGVAIANSSFPGGERVQLLAGGDSGTRCISPDYKAGALLARNYLIKHNFQDAVLVTPFDGDAAIEASVQALREEMGSFALRELAFHDIAKEIKRLRAAPHQKTCVFCAEDNIAASVYGMLGERSRTDTIELLALQGTGMINFPCPRLSCDYQSVGRLAARQILHGGQDTTILPSL